MFEKRMEMYITTRITFNIAQSGNGELKGARDFLYTYEPLTLEMREELILVHPSR
jgi:hypothetical protein